MKVYVVEEGYMGLTGVDSDGGGPTKAFSTKEKAIEYCRRIPKGGGGYGRYWEELEVDASEDQ